MGKISDLCTTDEVKLIAGVNNNEMSDDDIDSIIRQVSNYVYSKWGDPARKTQTSIVTNFYKYDFTGDDRRVYKMVEATMGGSTIDTGSYTTSTQYGYVTLGSSFVTALSGQSFFVKWIPEDVHIYTINKASIRVMNVLKSFQGGDLFTAQIEDLKEEMSEIEKQLTEKLSVSVIGSSSTALTDTRSADRTIVQDDTGQF